ncbi:YadA-like family protein [Mitsuokella sp. AF33-22]|uniref:YadA-like family protein n=1 Tax=Mitsuokella sp. AF33-22 TaxID=2292047 RepID=UPI001314885F|nr:YadA-like family protein [Mitsuokella sp. AF33-22]
MNHIYKVVWSIVKNAYVAVAEIARTHGKVRCTSQKILVALTVGAVVTTGISGNVYAAEGKVLAGGMNTASGEDSSVSGGLGNTASENYSSVSGGGSNKASGDESSVSGGLSNTASGDHSSVSGGDRNVAIGDSSSVSGGSGNTASGNESSISGGDNNTASGIQSSVSGGYSNEASGYESSVSGGSGNTASGHESSISGGNYNVAIGYQSSISGGSENVAFGSGSSIIGGNGNIALGQYTVSLGGTSGIAMGYGSTVIGGSTGQNASRAIAIGSSSVVTVTNGVAIGRASTTNEEDTIAFGHNAGDISGYTLTWQQRTDTDSEGKIIKNADGTTNDYTKEPVITENTYSAAGYNRLVKVADGKAAHDVATVEQTTELVAGDYVKVKDDATKANAIGQQRKKISVVADGTIINGNTGLVTGGTVYTALAGKIDTDLSNLTDAGKNAVKDIMKSDLGEKANKVDVYTKEETYNRTEIDNKFGGLTTDLSGKADADLSNLTDAGKNAVKDIMKSDLGEKANKADVYTKEETYNRAEIDNKVSGLTTDLGSKADVSLTNLTDEGKNTIKKLSQTALKVIAGSNTSVLEGKDTTGAKTYTVSVNEDAIRNTVKADLDQKVNKSADNLSAADVQSWQSKLDTGTIARGDTGLISGGKVFDALQGVGNYGLVKSDGKVVRIAADDSASVIDVSGNQQKRVVTGVKTDSQDPSSAANVAYVNENTQQIYQNMNNAYSNLKNDISRAAASSNALAALKPMEFDEDDKLQFGVGYGHYRNANAAAVGAFYQPDENCLMNLGATVGNGNPGISAGITIKFGPGGSGVPAMSKKKMAEVIHNQSMKLDEQSQEIETLKRENQEMREQLKMIMDKINK